MQVQLVSLFSISQPGCDLIEESNSDASSKSVLPMDAIEKVSIDDVVDDALQ